jgi:hypothetical protein
MKMVYEQNPTEFDAAVPEGTTGSSRFLPSRVSQAKRQPLARATRLVPLTSKRPLRKIKFHRFRGRNCASTGRSVTLAAVWRHQVAVLSQYTVYVLEVCLVVRVLKLSAQRFAGFLVDRPDHVIDVPASGFNLRRIANPV